MRHKLCSHENKRNNTNEIKYLDMQQQSSCIIRFRLLPLRQETFVRTHG